MTQRNDIRVLLRELIDDAPGGELWVTKFTRPITDKELRVEASYIDEDKPDAAWAADRLQELVDELEGRTIIMETSAGHWLMWRLLEIIEGIDGGN